MQLTITVFGKEHHLLVENGEVVDCNGEVVPLFDEIRRLEHTLDELFRLDGWRKTRTGHSRWGKNASR